MGYPVVVAGALFATGFLGANFFVGAWKTLRGKAFRGKAFMAPPTIPRERTFYQGGFDRAMTRREAALILGVSEDVVVEKIKEAHKKAMLANHPDRGGSHYVAYKINDAKDKMLKKT